jgi:FdhE protein
VATAPPGSPALTDLPRRRDDWRPWLALLDAARAASAEGAWRRAVPEAPVREDGAAPLLVGATLVVEPRPLGRWLRELLTTASAAGGPATSLAAAAHADTAHLAALLEAGLVEDTARTAALAAALGADASALGAVALVAPVPLLRACAGRWAARIAPAWSRGYCPICGAWAALAEVRGLERARRLRCVRCAADWGTPWLRCPYCGEHEHGRLGSLVLAQDTGGDGQPRSAPAAAGVDTCQTCHGYLKTVTTLAATPADDLALLDLATVELDAAALARGHARPAGPGAPLGARVVVRAGRLGGWWPA